MKKNFKVITINGVRGIFAIILIAMGLIAGFIISPGWLCMTLWNKYISSSYPIASMNIVHGIMLWAIIALSLYALNNKQPLVGFGSYQGLTPDQIKDIMNRTKGAVNPINKDFFEKINSNLSETNSEMTSPVEESQNTKVETNGITLPDEMNNTDNLQNENTDNNETEAKTEIRSN